ncbi:MAG: hypothetical protein DHS20C11_18240 [Lysobacteraceae bacterium]|nr:MAG: hypothetical protein DHS20C11_18240 [Xanthomonadaceae bacterium]
MRNASVPDRFSVFLVVATIFMSLARPAQAQVTADFEPMFGFFGCAPLDIAPIDSSTGPIEQWLWDFGDGQFSDSQNPTNTYQDPGVYAVSLTVAGAGGAPSDTLVRAAYAQVIGPDVDFIPSANSFATLPAAVDFTDMTIFGSPIVGWNWDFGDGNASNLQNPSHAYSSAGLYQVSLTVTDIDGCQRTVSKPGLIQVLAGLNATMSDEVIGAPAGGGRAQPGSIIRYTVTVENTGDQTLDDTEIQVMLDEGTLLVPESNR